MKCMSGSTAAGRPAKTLAEAAVRIPFRPLLVSLLTLAALACLLGCQARITEKSFDRVGRVGCKTEAEVRKCFGPGEEVRDSYTETLLADHKLPASARFVRYPDADNPALLHHVVYVEGQVVESDNWLPGKTAADRDKWVEICRQEYEKKHGTNAAALPQGVGP